jgi:copper/silver efflux system protein
LTSSSTAIVLLATSTDWEIRATVPANVWPGYQDFTVRPALQAVLGVAEVASLGGFERQYQIVIDPDKLVGFGLTVTDITRSVRDANAEVGARVLELAGREYVLRGRGYVKELKDLEQSVVTVGPGGTPIRLGDVASAGFGPEIRRGAADWNGTGEAVGGIVVMRIGSNARGADFRGRALVLGVGCQAGCFHSGSAF